MRTLEDFVKRAEDKHKEKKYDYSLIENYNGTKVAVPIKCPKHGVFEQTPQDHLRTNGCKKCSHEKLSNQFSSNTESFIKKANDIPGNDKKYDYTKCIYVNARTNVLIKCKIHNIEFEQSPNAHLAGKGCQKCARTSTNSKNTKTQDEFIREAKEVHKNKYKYDRTIYIKADQEVIITCDDHGDFYQKPRDHLNKRSGCPKCNGGIAYTQEEFLKLAIDLHDEKCDYSKTVYINSITPIIIRCTIHNIEYDQRPVDHLSSQHGGCQLCRYEDVSNKLKMTQEEFIDRATEKYGDLYDYSLVEYKNIDTSIKIICKSHGIFEQTPWVYLKSTYGCLECARVLGGLNRRKTTEEFIIRARNAHKNKYDYSKTIYELAKSLVTIICKTHGEFQQVAGSHLSGTGCPMCRPVNYSKASLQWLQYIEFSSGQYIQHAENGGEYQIPGTRLKLDGYCKDTNTVYEFHGDYWHGNPKVFNPNILNRTCGVTMGDLYRDTLSKKKLIQEKGFQYVEIWEKEWRNAIKCVKQIQRIWRKNKQMI